MHITWKFHKYCVTDVPASMVDNVIVTGLTITWRYTDIPSFSFHQLGKQTVLFFTPGLARRKTDFEPVKNRGMTCAECNSQSHMMFTTKLGQVVLFQRLPGYKIANG